MRITKRRVAGGIVAAAALLIGGVGYAATSSAADDGISANLAGPDGKAIGKVRFTNSYFGFGTTEVKIMIFKTPTADTKLNAFHGLHIHANDDPANGDGCVADAAAESKTWFQSADGHFKNDAGEMIGDMPNILIDSQGQGSMTFTTDRLDIDKLKGKPIVLHSAPDNAGNVPVGTEAEQYAANSDAAKDKTMKTGNAGDRIACGIIGGTTTVTAPATPLKATSAPILKVEDTPAAGSAASTPTVETTTSTDDTGATVTTTTETTETTTSADADSSGGLMDVSPGMSGMDHGSMRR